MKSKIYFSIILLVFITLTTSAQIKVKTGGKIIVGSERTTDDAYNVLTMQMLGTGGTYRFGSKLAFGDFGRYEAYGWNAFVGEYGDDDTDQLWLHGKNGIYLTRSNSSAIIAKYDASEGNKFTFYCDVYSYSTKLTSDERFKTNIKGVDSALVKLNKLNGVSYNYNFPVNYGKRFSSNSDTNAILSEKEKKDKEFFEKFDNDNKSPKSKHLGFIAQDLKTIFPELVEKDSAGYFYVDYVGLIPVIIEALKEQQSMIDAQSLKIKELETLIESTETDNTKKSKLKSATLADSSVITNSNIATNAFLYQNTPNPFTYDTKIKYFIPESSTKAVIYIFNLQGSLLKTNKIETTGFGEITINGSDLTPGMYIYSLLINGAEVDTKRMILSE